MNIIYIAGTKKREIFFFLKKKKIGIPLILVFTITILSSIIFH